MRHSGSIFGKCLCMFFSFSERVLTCICDAVMNCVHWRCFLVISTTERWLFLKTRHLKSQKSSPLCFAIEIFKDSVSFVKLNDSVLVKLSFFVKYHTAWLLLYPGLLLDPFANVNSNLTKTTCFRFPKQFLAF